MRRLLLFLVAALTVVGAYADVWTYNFEADYMSKQWLTNLCKGATKTAEITPTTKDGLNPLGGITWSYDEGTPVISPVTDGTTPKGVKFGTTSSQIGTISFKTSGFSGKKITKVEVKISPASKKAIYDVASSYGTFSATQEYTINEDATNALCTATFNPDVIGEEFSFSIIKHNGCLGSFKFCEISITYEDAPVIPPVCAVPTLTISGTDKGNFVYEALPGGTVTPACETADADFKWKSIKLNGVAQEVTGGAAFTIPSTAAAGDQYEFQVTAMALDDNADLVSVDSKVYTVNVVRDACDAPVLSVGGTAMGATTELLPGAVISPSCATPGSTITWKVANLNGTAISGMTTAGNFTIPSTAAAGDKYELQLTGTVAGPNGTSVTADSQTYTINIIRDACAAPSITVKGTSTGENAYEAAAKATITPACETPGSTLTWKTATCNGTPIADIVNGEFSIPETAAVGDVYQFAVTASVAGANGTTITADSPTYTVTIVEKNDGSEARPYTVEDVIEMPTSTTIAGVWVKGYIIGAVSSNKLVRYPGATPAILAISNSRDNHKDDESTGVTHIAVQLPTGNIRTDLDIYTNESLIGREVMIKGNIEVYNKVMGLKSASEYKFINSATEVLAPTFEFKNRKVKNGAENEYESCAGEVVAVKCDTENASTSVSLTVNHISQVSADNYTNVTFPYTIPADATIGDIYTFTATSELVGVDTKSTTIKVYIVAEPGTQTNPYTVQDLLDGYVMKKGTETPNIWVKGYVVGENIRLGKLVNSGIAFTNDHAVLADNPKTYASDETYRGNAMAVESKTAKDWPLNLLSNYFNMGAQVIVRGDLGTYEVNNIPFLKSPSECQILKAGDVYQELVAPVVTVDGRHIYDAEGNISPNYYATYAGKKVTATCATPGTSIRYTVIDNNLTEQKYDGDSYTVAGNISDAIYVTAESYFAEAPAIPAIKADDVYIEIVEQKGTLDNPYTYEDVIAGDKVLIDKTGIWVSGVINGEYNESNGQVNVGANYEGNNIVLSYLSALSDKNPLIFNGNPVGVVVELPAANINNVKQHLSLKNSPDIVKGNIKVFGDFDGTNPEIPRIVNTSDYVYDGGNGAGSAVKELNGEEGEARYVDIHGRAVSKDAKGIVIKIQNGKATKSVRL